MSSMERILNVEVTNPAGEPSITFNNIPQTFTDLYIIYKARTTRSNVAVDNLLLSVNGQGNSVNIANEYLGADGSQAFSSANGSDGGVATTAVATANVFSNTTIYIPNYTGGQSKTFSVDSVMENNATYSVQIIASSIWTQSDPISSITLDGANGNIVQYSSFTLYGITAGSDGVTTVTAAP
jgi:hypothetical protein